MKGPARCPLLLSLAAAPPPRMTLSYATLALAAPSMRRGSLFRPSPAKPSSLRRLGRIWIGWGKKGMYLAMEAGLTMT